MREGLTIHHSEVGRQVLVPSPTQSTALAAPVTTRIILPLIYARVTDGERRELWVDLNSQIETRLLYVALWSAIGQDRCDLRTQVDLLLEGERDGQGGIQHRTTNRGGAYHSVRPPRRKESAAHLAGTHTGSCRCGVSNSTCSRLTSEGVLGA